MLLSYLKARIRSQKGGRCTRLPVQPSAAVRGHQAPAPEPPGLPVNHCPRFILTLPPWFPSAIYYLQLNSSFQRKTNAKAESEKPIRSGGRLYRSSSCTPAGAAARGTALRIKVQGRWQVGTDLEFQREINALTGQRSPAFKQKNKFR